jgi:protoporphyrinogen IX oxidase
VAGGSESEGKTAAKRAGAALAVFAGLAAALFLLQPDKLYLWIKALHVIAVIAWMAGMFYLPRLFVYHADVADGSDASRLFKVMERRLLQAIINPAMVLTWVFGLWLAWSGFGFTGGWLHMKFAAVLALSAFHGYLSKAVRDFAAGRNIKTSRYWRLMNEVPTALMIVIVILVILKPF